MADLDTRNKNHSEKKKRQQDEHNDSNPPKRTIGLFEDNLILIKDKKS